MTNRQPTGAMVEIVERVDPAHYRPDSDAPADTVILPNEVRLNGVPLLTDDQGVTIHEMVVSPRGETFVRVTLTVLAKRVVMTQEPREEGEAP